jgi:menaquinone-dependent protoporphyrinogen oxidase
MDKETSVLVSYASKYGSTTGVAERAAARLGDHGSRVEVREVDLVDDAGAYDAIMLGSAVFDQSWIPDAAELVRRNLELLAARPVWLFSVGSFGNTHRAWGRLMTKEPREIGGFREAIHPRDYRVFAGVIERDRWPFRSRMFFRAAGGSLRRQPRLARDRRLGRGHRPGAARSVGTERDHLRSAQR